jgi:hypothetical protein
VVNRLVLQHRDTKQQLADLGERLRAAHAAMDGDAIRDLSAEQHWLINKLAKAAFQAADLTNPSAAVRDDVTHTLQAAIADPEVGERLGRLSKPERWSGFGAFGDAAPPPKASRETTTKARQRTAPARPSRPIPAEAPPNRKAEAAERRLQKLTAAVAAAERAKAQADDELSQRETERAAAQRLRDDALAGLRSAERELTNAERRYERARQSSRAAAESLREAKAQLRRA